MTPKQAPDDAPPQALADLRTEVAATHDTLRQLRVQQTGNEARMDNQLKTLSDTVNSLPEQVALACPQSRSRQAVSCDATPTVVQRVAVSDDKMVVGELERIWLDPPGAVLIARVDTGAQSSSLHAENLVEFERDGDRWVRFEVDVGGGQSAVIERPLVRYVRVVQQADVEGHRRPVVAFRIRIGDVQDLSLIHI